MTLTEDIKKLASKDGIKPNFSLLSRYSNFSEDQFYYNYGYYKSNMLSKVKNTLEEYDLKDYESDLFYFLVEIDDSHSKNTWARDVKKPSKDAKSIVQLKELLKLFSEVNNRKYKKFAADNTEKEIKQITFITNKNDHIKITADPLCYELICALQEHFYKNKDKLIDNTPKKSNINSKQYNQEFLLSLKPFINYLSKETINWESKNKIYKFVCNFIGILDIVFIPDEIKEALKPSRH